MDALRTLETRIITLHGGLSLRPTLERAAEIGELLREAKESVAHGEFQNWCRRLPFSSRTAQVYMRAAKAQATADLPDGLTLDRFLRLISKRCPVEVPDADESPAIAECCVVARDCREYEWPQVDMVATDPVWTDPDSYAWLGSFCRDKLVGGGLLLCQVGTGTMPDRVKRLEAAGLTYRWCLSVVFNGNAASRPYSMFSPSSVLVVVMSKGKSPRLPPAADGLVVRGCEKVHHPFQQPCRPWCVWLAAWSSPGSLIADPFAGAGSIGCAVRAVGGRRYLGCEVDEKTARVARKRIVAVPPGKGWYQEIDD